MTILLSAAQAIIAAHRVATRSEVRPGVIGLNGSDKLAPSTFCPGEHRPSRDAASRTFQNVAFCGDTTCAHPSQRDALDTELTRNPTRVWLGIAVMGEVTSSVKGVDELKSSFVALAMTVAVAGAITSAPHKNDGGAVVVQNYYYAKPAKVDEVYRWRVHASDVRARLGFARGRVLRRINTGDQTSVAQELPDVIWECEYPTIEDRERDASAVSASPEFQAVQKHMSTLIRRFERGTYRVRP